MNLSLQRINMKSMNIEMIRKDFPILQETIHGRPLIYLDNAATTQVPLPVLHCLSQHYMHNNGNVHRGIHTLSERSTLGMEAVREKVAGFIGAPSPDSILFTSGTTASINLAASSYCNRLLKPGDNIVVSSLEHHSNYLPWLEQCRRAGAEFRVLPLEADGTMSLRKLDQLLDQRTRIFAVTQVSNVTGMVSPIPEMVRLCHRRNIPILVDGAQAVRELEVDVQALDVDFYCFSGHKMLAPTGTGVLYVKDQWHELLEPVFYGGGMIQSFQADGTPVFEPFPLKLEAGTPNYAGIIALGAAVDYCVKLGKHNLAAQEHKLAELLLHRLEGEPEVRVLGTAPNRTGCISFTVSGCHPYDLALLLDRLGIAVRSGHHCAIPAHRALGVEHSVRASVAFYNTEAEIDAFIAGLRRAITAVRGKQ